MRPCRAVGSGTSARAAFLACLIALLASQVWAGSTNTSDAWQSSAPDTVATSPSVVAAAQLATVDVIADLIAAAAATLKTDSPCGPGAVPGALPSKPLPYGVDTTFVIDIANSTEPFNPLLPQGLSPAPETEKLKAVPGAGTQAYGGGPLQIPYSTRSAASTNNNPEPTYNYPWAPTGLLSIKFPNREFPVTCTGAVIAPGLLVTAAQCLHTFGGAENATLPSSIQFAPALYDRAGNWSVDVLDQPYGVWVAKTLPPNTTDRKTTLAVFLPPAWVDGTDVCVSDGTAPPRCQNDLAVVVMDKDKDQILVGEYAGYYGIGWDGYGASEGFYPGGSGTRAWQLTTLSFPPNFDAKLRQVRTDGPAFEYEQGSGIARGTGVLINDAGGPWIANFGAADPDAGLPAANDGLLPNVIVGVSAGGRVDAIPGNGNNSGSAKTAARAQDFKIQAATAFATTVAYPDLPNIVALVQAACDSLEPEERLKVCGDRAEIAASCRNGAGAGATVPAVPHTTAGAYSYQYSAAPDRPTVQGYVPTATAAAPWNAAGKLTITSVDGSTVERSAALIGPGLVLTAAEALVPYGTASKVTSVLFEPALFDDKRPLGAWGVSDFAVPAAWANGTAPCDADYSDRLSVRSCDSNYALIALIPGGDGLLPGSTAAGGSFFALPPTTAGNFSFTSQFFPADSNATGALVAQVTVLGYPLNGKRMTRTDGVATTLRLAAGGTDGGQTPGRFEMGSGVGEGGIGSVWVANFGAPFADEKYRGQVVPPGADAAGNVAVGVTGWWNSGIQGSSALGPDFFELVDEFCAGLGEQRGTVCGEL